MDDSAASPDRRWAAENEELPKNVTDYVPEEGSSDEDAALAPDGRKYDRSGDDDYPANLRKLFPTFSASRYAWSRYRKRLNLPAGVKAPGIWIKDRGPVMVEPKVWLANQRTFVKWMHISVLLGTLALALYNAAGKDNMVARTLAAIYTLIAIFAALWGWGAYLYRSNLIRQRSPKDLDLSFGPVVVSLALLVALCVNFGFKVRLSPLHLPVALDL